MYLHDVPDETTFKQRAAKEEERKRQRQKESADPEERQTDRNQEICRGEGIGNMTEMTTEERYYT